MSHLANLMLSTSGHVAPSPISYSESQCWDMSLLHLTPVMENLLEKSAGKGELIRLQGGGQLRGEGGGKVLEILYDNKADAL